MQIRNSDYGGLFETRPCYVAQTRLKFVISCVSPFSVEGIGTHFHI